MRGEWKLNALASIMETANSVVVILAVCIMPLEFQFENEYGSELTGFVYKENDVWNNLELNNPVEL